MTKQELEIILKERGYNENMRSTEGVTIEITEEGYVYFSYLTKQWIDLKFDPCMKITTDLPKECFVRYLDNFTEIVGFIIKGEGKKSYKKPKAELSNYGKIVTDAPFYMNKNFKGN